MRNKLDDKNIKLGGVLFEMKQLLDAYKLIGLNASKIKAETTGKTFFTLVQMLVMKLYAIDICKIFEEEKRNELNSIPGILTFIQKNNLKPVDFSPMQDFANKNGDKITQADNYCEKLNGLVKDFKTAYSNDFEIYKTWRDKIIGHIEDTKEPLSLSHSYGKIEKILFFAIDFYSMIAKAFVGNGPFDHQQEKMVITSLCGLLEKLGYNDIKVDFDN